MESFETPPGPQKVPGCRYATSIKDEGEARQRDHGREDHDRLLLTKEGSHLLPFTCQ
jgi:hypothetical protein